MTLKQLFSVTIPFAALLTLQACESTHKSMSSWLSPRGNAPVSPMSSTQIVDDKVDQGDSSQLAMADTHARGLSDKDIAQQVSSPNVIVYPLSGDPYAEQPREFPEYRGVLDNTVGGYTVFDPSVTVYGLDGEGMKPDYMPEYSVPKYATQPSVRGQMIPLPETQVTARNNTTSATSLRPRVPSAPVGLNNSLPIRPVKERAGQRRSPPILTGY